MENFNIVCSNPLICTYKNFLSNKLSNEINNYSYDFTKSKTRNSENADLRKSHVSIINNLDHENSLIEHLKEKLFVDSNSIELPLQIQKYTKDNFYKEHFDVNLSKEILKNTNLKLQRRLSIIIYLNDNFSGGLTSFSRLDIDIKPKKNMALVFENCIRETNFPNPLSIHQSTRIKRGTKKIINLWSNQSNYADLVVQNKKNFNKY